jgi:hypothetical protein
MPEKGTRATVREIAAAERINESYVGRVLQLTLLAPEIVGAILSGRQQAHVPLVVLMRTFPVLWSAQEELLLQSAISPSPLVAREQN